MCGGEHVDTGDVPYQHLDLPEGEDCDAIWSAFFSLVQASQLEDAHKDSNGQGSVHDVIESHVVGEAAGFL